MKTQNFTIQLKHADDGHTDDVDHKSGNYIQYIHLYPFMKVIKA